MDWQRRKRLDMMSDDQYNPHFLPSRCWCTQIPLGESEVVTEVSGTVGNPYGGTNKLITSIKFVTNLNKTCGPWGDGKEKDAPFTIPVQPGSGIVGFFARGGEFVEAIAVYVRPL